MDEEHSRESIQNEKETATEHTPAKVDAEKTEKPEVKENWNTVYSREKRLEELRRKRMEATSQTAVTPTEKQSEQESPKESNTDPQEEKPVEKNIKKQIKKPMKKSGKSSSKNAFDLEKIKKQIRRSWHLWLSERELQKKRHADMFFV